MSPVERYKRLFTLALTVAFIVSLWTLSLLYGHEGHNLAQETTNTTDLIIHWLGGFHPILLHFPIVFIVSTAIAELLHLEQAARFMLIGAAVTIVPTTLTGLAFAYHMDFGPGLGDFHWWHVRLGLTTTFLTLLALLLREYHYRLSYLSVLAVLVVVVTITGFMGGKMTFGDHTPPCQSNLQ